MQLLVNHFITHSDAFANFLINSCKSLDKAEMVRLSEKLCKLSVFKQRNRSLIKMLKRIRANMESLSTAEGNSLNRLHVLLILKICL